MAVNIPSGGITPPSALLKSLINGSTQGLLLPNEVAEITLTAFADNAVASLLNRRPRDLSGTLILHTVMGKDHFILISGEYRAFFLRCLPWLRSDCETFFFLSKRVYLFRQHTHHVSATSWPDPSSRIYPGFT